MDIGQIFQERLRAARKLKGLSQSQAAAGFGIAKVNYKNYEAGRRRPTFDALPRLADFFNVSLDYLMGRSDDPQLPRMDEETRELFRALQAFKAKQAQSPPTQ